MISAISNLRKLKSSSKEFDRDEVRPEFFGVRCVRADSATDRASVPGAVEAGGEERPHLELGSPA